MKNKTVTLKDVSLKTGYSLISVHRAVHGKEGVSKNAREEILKAVKEMGYEVNYAASSLKRKTLNIAFVSATSRNKEDYYEHVISGCKKSIKEFSNLNFNVSFFLYDINKNAEQNELDVLDEIFNDDVIFDGIVILPITTSEKMKYAIEKLIIKGSSVVLLDNDFPTLNRLCYVASKSFVTGQLAGELIDIMNLNTGKIVIAAGEKNSRVHLENLEGFKEYLNKENNNFEYIAVFNDQTKDTQKEIEKILDANNDVVAMYSIRETNTIDLCNAVINKNLVGKIKLIGSDLIPINRQMLKDGVLTAIVNKEPFERGYYSIKALVDFLVKKNKTNKDYKTIQTMVVLKSNLKFYECRFKDDCSN